MLEALKTQDPVNTSSRQAPLLKVPYITHKHHHQLRSKGSKRFQTTIRSGGRLPNSILYTRNTFWTGGVAWWAEDHLLCKWRSWVQVPRIYISIAVHIFTLTSSRGEAKTGKSSEVYRPANLTFTTVNEGLFLNTSERWGASSEVVLWSPHMCTHKHSIHAIRGRFEKMKKKTHGGLKGKKWKTVVNVKYHLKTADLAPPVSESTGLKLKMVTYCFFWSLIFNRR